MLDKGQAGARCSLAAWDSPGSRTTGSRTTGSRTTPTADAVPRAG